MIGNNTGHAQANLGKKRDGIMSDRVRKSMSIWNGYADRQKEEIRVLYRQCPGEEDQSVQFAIALIHGRWKIGIISNLRRGPVRLSQLRRMFPQASKKMLAQQLREMERDGLIIRTDLSGRLRHVEYSLSDSGGVAVLQLINTLTEWGSQYGSSLPKPEATCSSSGSIASGLRDCESSPLQIESESTGLALTELSEDDPALQGHASRGLCS
jgi:DNA-binding HxlR family transcriptional regulator